MKKMALTICLIVVGLSGNAVVSNAQFVPKLERSYKFNCDNLVPVIRDTTRKRIATDRYSIEQILDREIIYITDNGLGCKGVAIYSDGVRQQLKYGGKIDRQGEWLVEYSKRK